MLSWVSLNRWSIVDAVMHSSVMHDGGAECIGCKVHGFSVACAVGKEVLEVIQCLATSTTNQAVLWDVFFRGHQAPNKSIQGYFSKCLQQSLDCKFYCPSSSGDLSEYILVRKIMVGLYDPVLKRDLY